MGFLAKFYVFAAGITQAHWLLLAGVVLGSAVGLFYYLRLIIALFAAPEDPAGAGRTAPASPTPTHGLLAVLTAVLVGLGVYPDPFIALVRDVLTTVS